MIYYNRLIFILLIITSCQPTGLLKIKGSINNSLDEVSAAEMVSNSELVWVIQDAGNDNHLYGLNYNGSIKKDITITNAENQDWEDLTSDKNGNIYIGDFGNNNRKRREFRILKVNNKDLNNSEAKVEIIEFTLPESIKSKDFEAFFLIDNWFYILSKESKKFLLLKVPNKIGKHEALVNLDYKFSGKNNKITSADISEDGKKIALLNHDKLWLLRDYNTNDFFTGSIITLPFNHVSQKEGVCFKNDSTVIITDERNGVDGGNIYFFSLKSF